MMLPRQSDETNIEEYFELQNTKLYLSFSVKFKTKIYVYMFWERGVGMEEPLTLVNFFEVSWTQLFRYINV